VAKRRKLVVRGYHGTTLEAAQSIKKMGLFKYEEHDWHWLGDGVYFWQDAPLRAWEWALDVTAELNDELVNEGSPPRHTPAVIEAQVDITNCLDLLDIDRWPVIDNAWTVYRLATRGEHKSQVGPVEALGETADKRYGKNVLDCRVINIAVQLLEQYGDPVDAVRAAFMEGGAPYKGSWLRDRSHVQIVVRSRAILDKIKSMRIVRARPLEEQYARTVAVRPRKLERKKKNTMALPRR
jgi:hypothetical protein